MFFFFPSNVQTVFPRPGNRQYLCCWNGSTTSGGQALYSILSALKKKEKKNPLGFIFPASAILLWVCSEICFHQADSIRELGNEKSAIESDGERRGEGGGAGGGVVGGGIVQSRAGRNGREGRSNSYLKWAYPSTFLDFIIRYVWNNSVEWKKFILPPQKAESLWSSWSALTWSQRQGSPAGQQECKYGIKRLIVTRGESLEQCRDGDNWTWSWSS